MTNLPQHDPPSNATQVSENDVGLRNASTYRTFSNDELSEGNSYNGASTTTQGNYTCDEGYIAESESLELYDDNDHIWRVDAVADDEISIANTDLIAGDNVSDYTTVLTAGLWGVRREAVQKVTATDVITDPDNDGVTGSDLQTSDTDSTTIAAKITTMDSDISDNQTDITNHESRIDALEGGDLDQNDNDDDNVSTGTDGTNGWLQDTEKSWTTAQWEGKVLIDADGTVGEITENTTNKVTWENAAAPTVGSYKIRRQTFIEDNSITQAKLVNSTLELSSTKFASAQRLSEDQVGMLKKVTDSNWNVSQPSQYDLNLLTEYDAVIDELESARGGYATLGRRLNTISSPTGGLLNHLHNTVGGQGGRIPLIANFAIPTGTYTTAEVHKVGYIYLPSNIESIFVQAMIYSVCIAGVRTDNVWGVMSADENTNKVEITMSSGNTVGQYATIYDSPDEKYVAKYDLSYLEVYFTPGAANETALGANLTVVYYYATYDPIPD